MTTLIRDIIKAAGSKCIDKCFLEEFVNGDCYVLADILAWHAEDAGVPCRILYMESLELQFRHAFIRLDTDAKQIYVDAHGKFNDIKELITAFNRPPDQADEIAKMSVQEFGVDDDSFTRLVKESFSAKALLRDIKGYDGDTDQFYEQFFEYQNLAASFLRDALNGNAEKEWESMYLSKPGPTSKTTSSRPLFKF